METEYEKIIEGMYASYSSDREPFITSTEITFPERKTDFVELRLLREIFFPNYWNAGIITKNQHDLYNKLENIKLTFFSGVRSTSSDDKKSLEYVLQVMQKFPEIREMLKKDVEAYPAAQTYTDIIRCYPSIQAILIHRVAHEFYNLGVPCYPRELNESIHSLTGIDIHPGAKIGEYFFMDHGTGIVIGETSEIGNWVRIYQNVTLGALHFMKKGNGELAKNKRHPTIGDHVVLGMGAAIVGPIKIGNYVNIGAHSWIKKNVQNNTTIFVAGHHELATKQNGGGTS